MTDRVARHPDGSVTWGPSPWGADRDPFPPGVRDLIGLAPEADTPPPPLSDQLRRLKLVQACPHRSLEGCGCSGARCRARKGDFDRGRTSSVLNCLACQAEMES